MRVLFQNRIELLPLCVEFILAALSILGQRRVLQVLQIFIFPVHEDVGLTRPGLEHLVVNRLFSELHLVNNVGVQHIVLT